MTQLVEAAAVLFLCWIAVVPAEDEVNLFWGCVRHFRATRPALVMSPSDSELTFPDTTTAMQLAVITYASNEEEEIVLALLSGKFDLVFFAADSDLGALLSLLHRQDPLFSTKATILVPRTQAVDMVSLRLDSQLYQYSLPNGTMFERYTIGQEIHVDQAIPTGKK